MATNLEEVGIGELPEQVQQRIRQAIADFENRPRPRIAVVGRTGVGKSSIINMMRGLSDTDEGAAPVSDWGECHNEQKVYTYFGIDFEDKPGSDGVFQDLSLGTEYIERFQLDKADAVLFLWERAFDRNLAGCAKLLVNRHRRPVFFVRTKMDFVCQEALSHGSVDTEETLMQNVRKRAQQEMANHGLAQLSTDDRLFFLSTKIVDKHRFDAQRLLDQIPKQIRDESSAARVNSLFTAGLEGFIDDATRRCRKMIPMYSVTAGACGAIPLTPGTVGVSGLLLKATHDVTKEFGLTVEAFPHNEWARMVFAVGSVLAGKISLMVTAAAIAETANSTAAAATLAIPALAIVVEMVGGAAINVGLMRQALNLVIDECAKCAHVMYGAALEARLGQASLADSVPRILNQLELEDGELSG